jgi:hypothetical protein
MVLRDKVHPASRSRFCAYRTAGGKHKTCQARQNRLSRRGCESYREIEWRDSEEGGQAGKTALKQKTQTILADHPGLCSSAVTSELITSK